ncbi:hypothetical protein [Streptomyces triticisoli]|uniref:hypothetical protein n=1 Tax=Streptomyces triticisoli TaxID=2182797 RepID=UPI000DD785DB|nr:hypothetical protein [Streptomyces triticisoli]
MSTRYRIDCTNCGWHGYRRPHPLNECACYDEYAWYCRPNSPGPGCPNGANLFAVCPRCRNLRIEIWNNAPIAHHDKGKILVRQAWSRQHVAEILRGRAKLRRQEVAA